jgi:hypothetical protein
MKFLNKKEQILEIELTQYGKHLLSKGIYKPVYYMFFDDNILYDVGYVGGGEHQNEAAVRITKDTPSLGVQYVFDSIEHEVLKINQYIRNKDVERRTYGLLSELGSDAVQPQAAKFHSFNMPMGTSRLDKDTAPAWKINFLNGYLTGAVNLQTGTYQHSFIPKLTARPVTYEYKVVSGSVPGLLPDADIESDIDLIGNDILRLNEPTERSANQLGLGYGEFVDQLDDGNYLKVYDDSILLEVTEENTEFHNENFDIEVFKITNGTLPMQTTPVKILEPVYFQKVPENIQNDLLLTPEEVSQKNVELDNSYVEYFFDVLVDKEIDSRMLVQIKDRLPLQPERLGEPIDEVLGRKIGDLYNPVNEEPEEGCEE